MGLLIDFYHNSLLYSPNLFFVSLFLATILVLLLAIFTCYFLTKKARFVTEFLVDISGEFQKKGRKKKYSRTRKITKIASYIYITVNKKMIKTILFTTKIINYVKKEVLIKEGE